MTHQVSPSVIAGLQVTEIGRKVVRQPTTMLSPMVRYSPGVNEIFSMIASLAAGAQSLAPDVIDILC